ncbi:MAG: amidohydrolase family protein, partial [Myxococcota bacterium]
LHVIGDRAVRQALDALETVATTPVRGPHRLEHVQLLSEQDLRRARRLGVVASMQPVHWRDDQRWLISRLGAARALRAYPWRALREADVPLAFGSDAPVATLSPWTGVAAATGRQGARLTVREALAAYTCGAARACGESDEGALQLGARADMTLVDRDPFTLDSTSLAGVRVLGRLLDGVRA